MAGRPGTSVIPVGFMRMTGSLRAVLLLLIICRILFCAMRSRRWSAGDRPAARSGSILLITMTATPYSCQSMAPMTRVCCFTIAEILSSRFQSFRFRSVKRISMSCISALIPMMGSSIFPAAAGITTIERIAFRLMRFPAKRGCWLRSALPPIRSRSLTGRRTALDCGIFPFGIRRRPLTAARSAASCRW